MTQTPWTRNEVVFLGRLGQDPEMSYTTTGKALTKFSLAIDQGRNKNAMWLNVVCWEALAEQANEQGCKGALVEVKGRLSQRKYNERYYHDVVADSVEVITLATGKKKAEEENDSLGKLDEHPF